MFLLTVSYIKTLADAFSADFENTVTKGEFARDEQIPLLPQCFPLYSMVILSFKEVIHMFAWMISKSSAASLLYLEKRLIRPAFSKTVCKLTFAKPPIKLQILYSIGGW